MALDAVVDPRPVLEGQQVPDHLLLWCWDGKRLLWRDHQRCYHATYADHDCQMGDQVTKEDPFNETPKQARQARAARYNLPDPVTGEKKGRGGTTDFAKLVQNDYKLKLWTLRMTAKGLANSEQLLARVRNMDVSRDATALDNVCKDAKKAAGGSAAADLGTRIHTATEMRDTWRESEIDPEHMPRVEEYTAAVKKHGIIIPVNMVERKVISTRYNVGGTIDRIVHHPEFGWVILDVKTGKDLSYASKEIAIQLYVYAQAANEHGLWDPEREAWVPLEHPVREDIALVAHIPSNRRGCRIVKLPLAEGLKGAELAYRVKDYHRHQNLFEELPEPASGPLKRSQEDVYRFLIETSQSLPELESIMADLKSDNRWSDEYADLCRNRWKKLRSAA